MQQYALIGEKILQSSTSINDIAIIFRNNQTADFLEGVLRQMGIPSRQKGSLSLFDSVEIKLVFGIFMLLNNLNDELSVMHLFEWIKGVDSVMVKDIFNALSKLGNGDVSKGLNDSDENIVNPF